MIAIEPSSYETALATLVTLLVLLAAILVKALVLRQLHRLAAVCRLAFISYPEQILGATRLPFMLGAPLRINNHRYSGGSYQPIITKAEHREHDAMAHYYRAAGDCMVICRRAGYMLRDAARLRLRARVMEKIRSHDRGGLRRGM